MLVFDCVCGPSKETKAWVSSEPSFPFDFHAPAQQGMGKEKTCGRGWATSWLWTPPNFERKPQEHRTLELFKVVGPAAEAHIALLNEPAHPGSSVLWIVERAMPNAFGIPSTKLYARKGRVSSCLDSLRGFGCTPSALVLGVNLVFGFVEPRPFGKAAKFWAELCHHLSSPLHGQLFARHLGCQKDTEHFGLYSETHPIGLGDDFSGSSPPQKWNLGRG